MLSWVEGHSEWSSVAYQYVSLILRLNSVANPLRLNPVVVPKLSLSSFRINSFLHSRIFLPTQAFVLSTDEVFLHRKIFPFLECSFLRMIVALDKTVVYRVHLATAPAVGVNRYRLSSIDLFKYIYISLFQVLKFMSSLKAFLSWFTVSLKESQILLSLSLQWPWHFGRIFCSKTSNFFLYLPSNLSNRLSIDSWRLWIVVLTSFIPMLFSNMYSNEIGSKENKITVFMYVKRQHI